jgi:hypothetical protein
MRPPGAPRNHRCPPEQFGQCEQWTCILACVRFLRCCHEGATCTEEELRSLAGTSDQGYMFCLLARLLHGFGYGTAMCCLDGCQGYLGPALPVETTIHQARANDLEDWLIETATPHGPILVGVDTRRLPEPYHSQRGGYHAVAVLDFSGDSVLFLEPDPPPGHDYPKQGRIMRLDWTDFVNAWAAMNYIALRAWR